MHFHSARGLSGVIHHNYHLIGFFDSEFAICCLDERQICGYILNQNIVSIFSNEWGSWGTGGITDLYNREAKQRCEKTMLLVVLGASKQVNTQPIKVSLFLNSLLNGWNEWQCTVSKRIVGVPWLPQWNCPEAFTKTVIPKVEMFR